jgi:hypothetical protein
MVPISWRRQLSVWQNTYDNCKELTLIGLSEDDQPVAEDGVVLIDPIRLVR